MMLRAILVCLLLAAIVIPIVLAEMRRVRSRPVRQSERKQRPARSDSATKPPLRLVVPKTDMDRELADLLANSRKRTESDE